MTKLSFVSKPFEIQLLLGIKREINQLRIDVEELKWIVIHGINQLRDPDWTALPEIYSIPQDLASRFTAALDFNKPAAYDDATGWPLKEGFDALVFHFARSTVEYNPLHQRTPEEPQYLNLLKSKWIVQRLKKSSWFISAGPDSLWADYMRELEGDIRDEFKRFDDACLVAPDLSTLSRLPDECFSIWISENSSIAPPNLAEQRPLEDKVLELSLPWSFGTRYETLTLFRISDIDLRLVKTTKDEQNPFLRLEDSTELSMSSNRLIPIYVNPSEVASTNHNILLCNGQGEKPKSYSLKGNIDIEKFQQALTGYRVSHRMSNFTWCINSSLAPNDSGNGYLQLWHLKPLPKIQTDGGISPKQDDTSVASPKTSSDAKSLKLRRTSTGVSSQISKEQGYSTDSIKQSTRISGKTFISRLSNASTVKGSSGEGIALYRPEPPVLVIFTMSGGKRTYIHITSMT